ARRRLAVAVLPPPDVSSSIDALRRALGDPDVDRIPPHITLVPPVNVATERFEEALGVLRDAGRAVAPFGLRVGPPTTFLPATPVLYLAVDGEMDDLQALRDAVFVAPLERTLEWPFVAHLTLLADAAPDHIRAAIDALAAARFDFHVREVTLLEEHARQV